MISSTRTLLFALGLTLGALSQSPLEERAHMKQIKLPTHPEGLLSKRAGTPTQEGTDSAGLRYGFWTAGGGGDVWYDHTKPHEFSVNWTDAADFVCGKGWDVGSHRAISYHAVQLDTGDRSFLAVYSKTKNPTIEYYIVDNHGPKVQWGKNDHKGTFDTDGGTYDIYMNTLPDSHHPGQDFTQFWSVRTETRTSGTINTGAHFDFWASKGMLVNPAHGDQSMSIEAFRSTGSATVMVAEGYIDLTDHANLPASFSKGTSTSTSPSGTRTEMPMPDESKLPTKTNSASPTPTHSKSPTETLSESPTPANSKSPAETPSKTPSETAAASPTGIVGASPTEIAGASPTDGPSKSPSETAVASPSDAPLGSPSAGPSPTLPTASPAAQTIVPGPAPTEIVYVGCDAEEILGYSKA